MKDLQDTFEKPPTMSPKPPQTYDIPKMLQKLPQNFLRTSPELPQSTLPRDSKVTLSTAPANKIAIAG